MDAGPVHVRNRHAVIPTVVFVAKVKVPPPDVAAGFTFGATAAPGTVLVKVICERCGDVGGPQLDALARQVQRDHEARDARCAGRTRTRNA
jgi:hypothetical protein